MNTILIITNILMFMTLLVHAIGGDKDLKESKPDGANVDKLEKWVMARGAFHLVTIDVLLATIGLTIINFTNLFEGVQHLLLKILALYFLLYAISFLVVITISKQFPNNYWKLGQWILLLTLSGLLYIGAK
jgi:hypothetical protein